MDKANPTLRLSATAIAAVLALSSTPLLAQTADGAAVPSTPVLVTPPPVAPVPMANAPVASPSALPGGGLSSVTIPKISLGSEGEAARSVTTAAPERSGARHVPASPRRATSLDRASVPVERTAASTLPAAETAPEAAPSTGTAPVAAPAPIVTERVAPAPVIAPPVSAQARTEDDMLPVAGIAGLGALALLGGAYALRRRRGDDDAGVPQETVTTTPVAPATEPALATRDDAVLDHAAAPYAGARSPEPARDGFPAASLPAGFDISRFGRHVQAAYRGPTPENPSLSLKKRLKRASFYDQRERMAAMPAESRSVVAPGTQQIAVRQRDERAAPRTSASRNPRLRPAFG